MQLILTFNDIYGKATKEITAFLRNQLANRNMVSFVYLRTCSKIGIYVCTVNIIKQTYTINVIVHRGNSKVIVVFILGNIFTQISWQDRLGNKIFYKDI